MSANPANHATANGKQPVDMGYDRIIDLIGFEKAFSLIQAFGGKRLYVPSWKRLTIDHKLVDSLGWDDALLLCEQYGGNNLVIPTGKKIIDADVESMIFNRYEKGETAAALARQYFLAENTIYRMVKRHRLKLESLEASKQAAFIPFLKPDKRRKYDKNLTPKKLEALEDKANSYILPKEGFISVNKVAAIIGVHKVTLYRMIRQGKFPRIVKISQRSSRFNCVEVWEWINEKTARGQGHD